jgi:uncharacterized protein (TIGR01777 family)
MATVLITGGTGMIGRALTKALVAKGYHVIILTRKIEKHPAEKNISYAEWNVEQQTIDEEAIKVADYIIHLAGANVADGRWTETRKKEIIDSRVKSGELIVKSLKEIPNKVKAVVSAAGIGYYGPDKTPVKAFSETDPHYNDFLGTVVKQWEEAIQPVVNLGKRLVIYRTGIVLSNEGGAYLEFKKPMRFRVATILGNGKQIVSWIHIDDLIRLYIEAIENKNFKGVYNAVAPEPVSNEALIHAIVKASGKKFAVMHVPSFALKLVLGEMSIEVLKRTTVSSARLQQTGFKFLFRDINSATAELER